MCRIGGECLGKRLRRIGGERLRKRLRRIGEERLGKRRHRISNVCQCSWSNITWVFANLGFIVHTLCHYCGMIATAADNKVSKHLEVA